MASAELAALALQGIPVLHKPVTPARLRRTLEMLWQQAELDKGRAAAAPSLRENVSGNDAQSGVKHGAFGAAASVPPGAPGPGSQTQSQSESQK
jgi:hypothetical protein